ncbi:ABC transporter permease [Promicromonospora citrea]|uniref:ABC transporter permease n=1 Tax=Promicromonospora citrea TaxID=43677 RepID=A0A8H9GH95_9MICO|nr:FtsX-like permease family protein [Promicromonospora citrea]NNH52693.1 FtsX-like permease family protein [Promicromonospora citrea]GGM27711.1 ABC transporter permease [Promicromonospora citrea]
MTATTTPPTTTPVVSTDSTPALGGGSRYPTARLTLGQMRRSTGRLAAAGIAILISTAFVTVTLLVGNIVTSTTYDQVSARYADADLVVSHSSWELTPEDAEAAGAVDGVAAVQAQQTYFTELSRGGKVVYQSIAAHPADERLSPLRLAEGDWPQGQTDIALPTDVAERLGLGVGDTVNANRWIVDPEPEVQEDGSTWYDNQEVTEKLTVTGLVEDPYQAYALTGGMAVVSAATLDQWVADDSGPDSSPTYDALLVALDDPAALEEARQALAEAVPSATDVLTTQEYAEQVVAEMSGGQNIVFLVFVLAFAGVALVVAGLVIANTFQVLVAQRSRMLALLRCIGADTGQLYRSVLLEAAILGLIASVAGVVLGALLVQAGLLVAPSFDLGVPLPGTISLNAAVVLVPLAVGVLVTLVAAVTPARAASRVAPLAALRPSDAPTLRGAGKVRAVLATLLTVGGVALLVGGMAMGRTGQADLGILAAVLGGSVSLVGVIVGAVFWLPRVAGAFGRLVGTSGPAARLAAANTQRNPRRTAATATALLIGVTLVSMMTTGAASARVTLDQELDAQYPVDLQVGTTSSDDEGNPSAMPGDVTDAVRGVGDLRAVAEVTTYVAETTDEEVVPVVAATPEALTSVLNTPEGAEGFGPGTLLVPAGVAKNYGLEGRDTITLSGPAGEVTLDVVPSDLRTHDAFLTPLDLAAITPAVAPNALWAGVADGADVAATVAALQDAVSATEEAVEISGAVVEREAYQQVIDVILGIVVGLLAVAVVIALIGVANTLSLSVIERTRENAMLRAIGLTTGQLRGTLAVEGMLIAGVGAVLGIVLGLVYGWAGATAALGNVGTVPFVVPWAEVGVMLAVALVAGLVASVVPARAAVRTRPVAALAAE